MWNKIVFGMLFCCVIFSFGCQKEKGKKGGLAKNEKKGFTYLRTKTYSCGGVTNTVHEYKHDATGLEFVLVPGGSFQMGSTKWSYSQPVHSVTLKPFLMSIDRGDASGVEEDHGE